MNNPPQPGSLLEVHATRRRASIDPRLSRSKRLLVAALAGGFHLLLQAGLYALGFALGPEGATREVLGISLYGVTSVVTFPFVPLVERLGWSGLGLLALPANSAAWAGGLYLALGLAPRGR